MEEDVCPLGLHAFYDKCSALNKKHSNRVNASLGKFEEGVLELLGVRLYRKKERDARRAAVEAAFEETGIEYVATESEAADEAEDAEMEADEAEAVDAALLLQSHSYSNAAGGVDGDHFAEAETGSTASSSAGGTKGGSSSSNTIDRKLSHSFTSFRGKIYVLRKGADQMPPPAEIDPDDDEDESVAAAGSAAPPAGQDDDSEAAPESDAEALARRIDAGEVAVMDAEGVACVDLSALPAKLMGPAGTMLTTLRASFVNHVDNYADVLRRRVKVDVAIETDSLQDWLADKRRHLRPRAAQLEQIYFRPRLAQIEEHQSHLHRHIDKSNDQVVALSDKFQVSSSAVRPVCSLNCCLPVCSLNCCLPVSTAVCLSQLHCLPSTAVCPETNLVVTEPT